MTDFTKDELYLIYKWGYACTAYDYDTESAAAKIHESLLNKVHAMIDELCKQGDHYYEFSLGPGYCENCCRHEND